MHIILRPVVYIAILVLTVGFSVLTDVSDMAADARPGQGALRMAGRRYNRHTLVCRGGGGEPRLKGRKDKHPVAVWASPGCRAARR